LSLFLEPFMRKTRRRERVVTSRATTLIAAPFDERPHGPPRPGSAAKGGIFMSDAVIIPFPARPSQPEDRLRLALTELQNALEAQRRAMSDWRFAMAELGVGVAGLSHSLALYQDALGGVDEKLSTLRQNATQLEQMSTAAEAAFGK
jgi:hypothetical protein